MSKTAVRRRGRQGNGAIEFALGFSLLWACFSGVFQYGYSMYTYNALQNAVTAGATYASRATICSTDTTYTAIKQMVVYGDPTVSSGSTIVPGLDTSKVQVLTTPSGTYPKTITVRVVNFTVNALFQSFTFSNKPVVTMMYLGNYQTGGC